MPCKSCTLDAAGLNGVNIVVQVLHARCSRRKICARLSGDPGPSGAPHAESRESFLPVWAQLEFPAGREQRSTKETMDWYGMPLCKDKPISQVRLFE